MDIPFLVYCSLLKKAQYRNWRDLAAVNPGVVDMAAVDEAIRETVEKRMRLAQDFLSFSESLVSMPPSMSEIADRNAVSRAYYAVHHAIRALLLFEERGDVDGHRESIEAACSLLKRNPAVRSKLGETEKFRAAVLGLLEQRHLADYYPYGTNDPNELPSDFHKMATEAIQFAQRIIEKTLEYITLKESGKIECPIQSQESRQTIQLIVTPDWKSCGIISNRGSFPNTVHGMRIFYSMWLCFDAVITTRLKCS